MGTINTDEDFERVANGSNPLGWDGDGLDRGHLAPAADSF